MGVFWVIVILLFSGFLQTWTTIHEGLPHHPTFNHGTHTKSKSFRAVVLVFSYAIRVLSFPIYDEIESWQFLPGCSKQSMIRMGWLEDRMKAGYLFPEKNYAQLGLPKIGK